MPRSPQDPELTGMTRQQLSALIDTPAPALEVQRERVLRTRRGHERLLTTGTGAKAELAPADRILVTVLPQCKRAAMDLIGQPMLILYEPRVVRERLPPPSVTAAQLRDRSRWEGPELYVVVDDHDLGGNGRNSPLAPLVDYLPQARELGFHLIAARRVSGFGRTAMTEPLLTRGRELGAAGLVLSGDPKEGVLISGERAAPRPRAAASWSAASPPARSSRSPSPRTTPASDTGSACHAHGRAGPRVKRPDRRPTDPADPVP
ncbi:hypothetical protein LIU39_05735 [Streptomyces sp. SF28]|nr:hypothetical protein [Streptomyces pinistramenti]MCB5906922.1 hypothetical protein [Streptomyces pinistramenti]